MRRMDRCALCSAARTDARPGISSLLCPRHEGERLTAASLDRILRGGGLTYANAERFSQKNYIRLVRGMHK